MGGYAVNGSIQSTHSLRISITFNKSSDLFWEQRAGGSNPSAPTIPSHAYCERYWLFYSRICFFRLSSGFDFATVAISLAFSFNACCDSGQIVL